MDLQLKGKKALVCASSRGIGRAIAAGLAQEGVELFLCARDVPALRATADALAADHGVRVHHRATDLLRTPDVEALATEAAGTLGTVDILVINVGGPPPSTAVSSTEDQWRGAFERLFLSASTLVRALLPGMRQRGFGRILAVTSLVAVEPNTALAVSTAMRAGLTAYLKTLSIEVAADGVTVHTLMPGLVDTDRLRQLREASARDKGGTVEDEMRRMTDAIPMKRLGRPEEFAALAVFLASPRASYLTGLNLAVDGGSRRAIG